MIKAFELIYIQRGLALWQIDGEDIAVESGQILHFPLAAARQCGAP